VTALPARKENMAAMVAAVAAMVATVDPGGFPNDIMGPVRGWRSWNAVFSDVTQEFMTRQVGVVCV
jgi:spore germination cell wall hydrolase CwlJ-like protein